MSRSIAFYRLLGLELPETPDEGHVQALLPNGVSFMLDSEDIIRSFKPDWTRASGNQIADRVRVWERRRGRRAVRARHRRRLPRREGAVGRVLGPALRAAPGSRRRRRRPLRNSLIEEAVELAGRAADAASAAERRRADRRERVRRRRVPARTGRSSGRAASRSPRSSGRLRATRSASARARRRARAAVARRRAPRRRRARDGLGRRRRRAPARERRAEPHSAPRRAGSLGRARRSCSRRRRASSCSEPTCSTRSGTRAAARAAATARRRRSCSQIPAARSRRTSSSHWEVERGRGRRAAAAATVSRVLAVALAVALLVAPPRPHIVWKPIPFGATRVAETAAYSQRHYGVRTARPASAGDRRARHRDVDASRRRSTRSRADVPDAELHELPGTCAHFVIDRDGTIYQLVRLTLRCRHTVGLNWAAIGIEHVGLSDAQVLDDAAQMRTSLALTRLADGALPHPARERDRPQREPLEPAAPRALRAVALPDARRLEPRRHERLPREARRARAADGVSVGPTFRPRPSRC